MLEHDAALNLSGNPFLHQLDIILNTNWQGDFKDIAAFSAFHSWDPSMWPNLFDKPGTNLSETALEEHYPNYPLFLRTWWPILRTIPSCARRQGFELNIMHATHSYYSTRPYSMAVSKTLSNHDLDVLIAQRPICGCIKEDDTPCGYLLEDVADCYQHLIMHSFAIPDLPKLSIRPHHQIGIVTCNLCASADDSCDPTILATPMAIAKHFSTCHLVICGQRDNSGQGCKTEVEPCRASLMRHIYTCHMPNHYHDLTLQTNKALVPPLICMAHDMLIQLNGVYEYEAQTLAANHRSHVNPITNTEDVEWLTRKDVNMQLQLHWYDDQEVPVASFETWKVGGEAYYLLSDVDAKMQLVSAIKRAQTARDGWRWLSGPRGLPKITG
ncbi:hypothetical protein DAEQUDRAFT_483016 [Daedalea quercina L-15889]|uniref:Uncharacterized protein n=1 Tax=Daedalea quercina L-15889 TaxID=1314783 RepID=A0A165MUZ8_9APHY|nr:hypothetical protein DAEQUDRAFT_483016 [Daedalea quercina L-15889]